MHQINYIKHSNIDQIKEYIKRLFDNQIAINVVVKKTRTKSENYNVTIKGVYPKFFTVYNSKLNINFTIEYIDLITGNISINEIDQKEGD